MAKILENIEKDIVALPASLKVFLTDAATVEKIKAIAESFHFDETERGKVEKIIADVAAGDLNLYDVATELSDELGLELDAAMDVSGKLYEDLFIDLEDDIKAQYAAHQASAVAQPVKKEEIKVDVEKIKKEKEELLPLIDKAVKKFGLFTPSVIASDGEAISSKTGSPRPLGARDDMRENEDLKKKFSEIAGTFLSGVRTKSQFKNTLTKPIADGGLQMAHQLADDVADFLASYMRIGEIEKKKKDTPLSVIPSEARAEPRDLTPSKKQTGEISPRASLGRNDSPPHPVPPNVKIEVTFEKEEKEAAAKKPKIEKMKIAAPKLLSVTEGVGKALAELNYTFPSSELQARLKSVIDARVRSVRTSLQTFDKLTQDIPSGGMGFSKLEADKVSLILNKYLKEKNKDIYSSKLAEIKQAEDEEKKKNEERAHAAEEAEKKKMDEKFTKLTGKASTPLPVIASEARQSPPALTKSEIAEKKAAPSRPLAPPSPPLPSPKAIPQPQYPSAPKPSLEDIKYTPKLAGPVEEIARLTLEDFRKLSGDPKEAILKIKDKLGLLRGESYKKYQAGIDAWYRSPLYGEYVKAMSQSLIAGAPLGDILKGGQTLTQDEFDAIIDSRIE